MKEMCCNTALIGCLALLLWLQGATAEAFPCYAPRGADVDLTLDDTVHLSDVVLLGRIVSVTEGESGTHTAVVSYYYSYKNDDLLPRRLFWSTSVSNFSPAPSVGQLGLFFLFREPTMQLALFCSTPVGTLLVEGSYQEIINRINEVGSNDTRRNRAMAITYPSPCSAVNCGEAGYCNEVNTLPGEKTRCSCMTGYSKELDTGLCRALESEKEWSYCSQCSHNARCVLGPNIDSSSHDHVPRCSCEHIDCREVLSKPLCGSDGRRYGGLCQLRKQACQQQKNIHKLYDGECNSNTPRPCMGYSEPLATSGGLIQCVAMDLNSCPPGHFCHTSLPHYSVCCPVLYHPNSSVLTPTATTPPTNSQSSPNTGSGDSRESDTEGSASDTERSVHTMDTEGSASDSNDSL